MKKYFFLLFLSLFLTIGFAQSSKKIIKSDFERYIKLTLDGDFEKSMDFVYPKLFDFVPKEQMITLMKGVFNDPNLEINLHEPKDYTIGKINKIDGKFYSLVTYENKFSIKIKLDDENEKTETDKLMMQAFMLASFKETLGTDNVVYNQKTGFYDIETIEKTFAISEKKKSGWKFLTAKKEYDLFLKNIIPQKLLDKVF